jgi:hypothetical protein
VSRFKASVKAAQKARNKGIADTAAFCIKPAQWKINFPTEKKFAMRLAIR